MKKIKEFIKNNKAAFVTGLIAIILLVISNWDNVAYKSAIYDYSFEDAVSSYASPMPGSIEMQRNSLQEEYKMMDDSAGLTMPSAIPMEADLQDGTAQMQPERKIIKQGSYELEVDDTDKVITQIQSYLAEINGFTENIYVWELGDTISSYNPKMDIGNTIEELKKKEANLTILIPSEKYNEFISKIKTFGYINSENVSSTDVTETYQDTASQIENLKAREAKVLEFYNKAQNVEETLKIYTELENIRFQRETLEKQLQNLDKNVGYSTILLHIYPKLSIEPFSDSDWNISKVWKEKINLLKTDLRDLAEAGVEILLYGIFWGPIALAIIVFLIKRKKKKK